MQPLKTPYQQETLTSERLTEQIAEKLKASQEKGRIRGFVDLAVKANGEATQGLFNSIKHVATALASKGRGGADTFGSLISAAAEDKGKVAGNLEQLATVVEFAGPKTAMEIAFRKRIGDPQFMTDVKATTAKVENVFERLIKVTTARYDESTGELSYVTNTSKWGDRDSLGEGIVRVADKHGTKKAEAIVIRSLVGLGSLNRVSHKNVANLLEAAQAMDSKAFEGLPSRIAAMGAPEIIPAEKFK